MITINSARFPRTRIIFHPYIKVNHDHRHHHYIMCELMKRNRGGSFCEFSRDTKTTLSSDAATPISTRALPSLRQISDRPLGTAGSCLTASPGPYNPLRTLALLRSSPSLVNARHRSQSWQAERQWENAGRWGSCWGCPSPSSRWSCRSLARSSGFSGKSNRKRQKMDFSVPVNPPADIASCYSFFDRTILSCLCPCCICCSALANLAVDLVKLPVKVLRWFTDQIPC